MSLLDLSPERSIMALPGVQSYARASDGLFVTPMIGRIATEAGVTEALMGSDGATAAEFPSLVKPRGFFFDSSDDQEINCGDNDLFSFVGDSPFSVACISSYDSRAAGAPGTNTLFAKTSGGVLNREWYFITAAENVFFRVFDSGGDFIGRKANGANTGEIVEFVAVYDGSGTAAGLRIYRNGVRVDDADASSGGYDGTFNGPAPLVLGDDGNNNEKSGLIVCPILYDFALSENQVKAVTDMMRRWGITP